MTDTSGPTSATPLAYYDPVSSCWRTSQATFLSEDQPSLPALPASGMTHDGWLYELPTLAPATDAPDSSSLPTPQAHDAHGGKTPEQVDAMRTRCGAGVSNLNEVIPHMMLPTPVANDDHKTPKAHLAAKVRSGAGETITSLDVMARQYAEAGEWSNKLLPTPTVVDAKGGRNITANRSAKKDTTSLGWTLSDVFFGATTGPPSPDTPMR